MKKAMTVDKMRIVNEEQAMHAEAVKDQHEESVWRVVKERNKGKIVRAAWQCRAIDPK